MQVETGATPDDLLLGPELDGDGTAVPVGTGQALGATGLLVLLAAALVVAMGWHITQGTSDVGFGDLWSLAFGGDGTTTEATRDILWGSRLPRVSAAVAVGFALGVAGTLLQSLARNAL